MSFVWGSIEDVVEDAEEVDIDELVVDEEEEEENEEEVEEEEGDDEGDEGKNKGKQPAERWIAGCFSK